MAGQLQSRSVVRGRCKGGAQVLLGKLLFIPDILLYEAIFVEFEDFTAFDNLGWAVVGISQALKVLLVVAIAIQKLLRRALFLHQLLQADNIWQSAPVLFNIYQKPMRTVNKIQQGSPPPRKAQQPPSKVTYIKRTSTQVFAAQENISSYYRPATQSLEKVPETASKKPLSRRNSQIGPKLSYPVRHAHKPDLIEIREEQKKKYVGRTPEEIAMHLSASIFMMATTKFVPGYDDLSSLSSQAKSSRQKPISPLKPREGQSTPHNRQSIIETHKAKTPAKAEPNKSVEPKKAASTVKEAGSNRYSSSISGLIENSPRFNSNISNFGQKSKLQQSFDEIASQNASRVSRPEVRIREIQPSEIVHVPSGIRTKVNQPSQSSVKSSVSKNPESSIHRIAGQVYVNAARYGNGPNTPKNQNNNYSPQNEPAKGRSISQPAKQMKGVRSQADPLSPKKDLKEDKEEPSIIRMGGLTPAKVRGETTPMKYNNGTTPIKSTIGLESRTDLPRPQNPSTQKNPINQYNGLQRPETTQIQNSNRQVLPSQGNRVNNFYTQEKQNNTIRNRFQAEVITEKPSSSSKPVRSLEKPTAEGRQKVKPAPRIERANQQSSNPTKRYPYNDTIIRPKGPLEKVISIEPSQSSQVQKRPARSIEHAAYHMTTQTFLNSTTKYVKQAGLPSQNTNTYNRYSPQSEGSKIRAITQSAQKDNRNYPSAKTTTQPKISPQKPQNTIGTRLNNRVPNSQYVQHKILPAKQQPQATNPSPSKEPNIQTTGQSETRVVANYQAKMTGVQPYESRNNRFKASSQQEDQKSTDRAKGPANSLQRTQAKYRTQKIQRKQEDTTTNKQVLANQVIKTQKNSTSNIGKTDGQRVQQRQEQRATPFARQPAGGRSPLLFKASEQSLIEKQPQLPASKSPISQTQINPRPIQPISTNDKTPAQEKSIKIGTGGSNSSIISPRATHAQPQKNITSNALQQKGDDQRSKKQAQITNTKNRYGAKPAQSHRTDDNSYPSDKNTTNTLAGSKSSETFQKVWSSTSSARVNRNKTELSNTGAAEESVKKERFQAPNQPNQGKPTLAKKIAISSDESIKLEKQKNAHQNGMKTADNGSDKLKHIDYIGGSKSPTNKNVVSKAPSARTQANTANTTKVTTNSPQNSTIQSNSKASINNQTGRYSKLTNTHQASSPQPASAKVIKHVTSPAKEATQPKSESHIKTMVATDIKIPEGQKSQREQEVLQRCCAFAWIISRLRVKVTKASFKALIQHHTQKSMHMKQASILAFTANSVLVSLTKNIYSTSFAQLKKSYMAMQRAKKDAPINSVETKNRAAAIICSFLLGKVRSGYQLFRFFTWIAKQKGRTSRQSEPNLKVKQDSLKQELKKKLISSIIAISKAFHTTHIKQSFGRMLIAASKTSKKEVRETSRIIVSKTPVSQAKSPQKMRVRNYEGEKKSLLDSKVVLQSEIQSIQFCRVDKKKVFDRQKAKLIKKMEQLRKKNDSVQVEVNDKRKKNQQFKKLIANRPLEAEDELFPVGEPLLNLLTEIYLDVFKTTKETIDKKQFVKKYLLNSEDCNIAVQEWNALAESLRLKAQIARWEGIGQKQSKVRRSLLQEREKEASLMRNYIRERYLWEWVHTVSVKL